MGVQGGMTDGTRGNGVRREAWRANRTSFPAFVIPAACHSRELMESALSRRGRVCSRVWILACARPCSKRPRPSRPSRKASRKRKSKRPCFTLSPLDFIPGLRDGKAAARGGQTLRNEMSRRIRLKKSKIISPFFDPNRPKLTLFTPPHDFHFVKTQRLAWRKFLVN